MPDGLDLHRVWEAPAFLPYVHPPLTNATLAAAEQQLGVTLPRRYVDLLRIQNGGYIRLNLPSHPHHRLFGIGTGGDSILTFRWPEYAAFRKGIIPIDGEATWYLCFDYRHVSANPPLVSVEMSDDVPCYPFLPSFDDYLSRLFLNLDWNEHGIIEDLDADQLMQQIASRLDLPRKPTAGPGFAIHLAGRPHLDPL